MKNAKERLEWLVEFARKKLVQQPPGELLNLRHYCNYFISGKGELSLKEWGTDHGITVVSNRELYDLRANKEKKRLFAEYEMKDFQDLQKEVLGHFDAIIQSRESILKPSRNFFNPVSYRFVAGYRMLTGWPKDLFLWVASDLIQHSDPNKLKLCPECNLPFFKVRRKLYCSRTCTLKAYNREYYKSKKAVIPNDKTDSTKRSRTRRKHGK